MPPTKGSEAIGKSDRADPLVGRPDARDRRVGEVARQPAIDDAPGQLEPAGQVAGQRAHRHRAQRPVLEPAARAIDGQAAQRAFGRGHAEIGAAIATLDKLGVDFRDKIGVANIMFESDYPHSDSNFPHSRKKLEEVLADVPDSEARAIAEDNARRVFNFPRV